MALCPKAVQEILSKTFGVTLTQNHDISILQMSFCRRTSENTWEIYQVERPGVQNKYDEKYFSFLIFVFFTIINY